MIKSNLYRIATVLCFLLLTAATVFVIIRWPQMPDQIPMHYNFAGEVNSYGSKWMMLLLMGLAWVALIVLSISVKYPEKWNMPVKVTAENKSRLFAITRAMVEVIKVLTTMLFVLLFISAPLGTSIPQWAMIILFSGVMLTVIVGMALIYKNK